MKTLERFKPLKRYYTWQVLSLLLLMLVLSVSAGVLITSISTIRYGVIAAIGMAVFCIVIATLKFSGDAMVGAEFLARAILHVSRERSSVGAPSVKTIPASQDFFEELAGQVYDMASSSLGINAHQSEQKQQKQSNTQFEEALLQNSPVPILVLDKDNKLVYANQAALEYTRIKPENSYGKLLYDVLTLEFAGDESLDTWLSKANSERLTGIKGWDRVKLTLDDDSTKQCDMAVRFNKDNPEGVETVIMLFDHTEKYTKDDHGASFVSMAVHELRTPLTVMRGYIEVFEDEVAPTLNAEQAEFMRNLSAQAQQLAAFVNNIMNFARIEENELSVVMKEEDWGEIIRSTVHDMELRAQVRHKTINVELPETIPHVAVDRTTIGEVLINLLENAIKYTHSENAITVRVVLKENFIETTVEDQGIGIPPSLIGHIFDKFYRSHRSNRTVGGTGLGLYLSKAIVTAHGGQIWVKSKEGEGSTFGFTVPTFESVADQINSSDNKGIVRGAHGWIKNHTMYRG